MTAPYHRPADPAARVGHHECGFCGHCWQAQVHGKMPLEEWRERTTCPRGCPKGQLRLPMRGAA